jgi:outer membrane protein OmpA-like peptidoglycan-associated protein
MSFNLIESVKEVFSVDMTNKLADMTGESPTNLQQAMQGIVPSVLTGVLLKAESADMQETLNLATDASRIDIPFNLNSLAGGVGSSKGMDYLKNLFGEKTTGLSEAVSTYAGISSQSASALMSIAAPAALGVLGKHILNTNMNASGLRSFLNGQRNKILNQMPTGLFLEGIMGIENLSGISEKFSFTENPAKRSGKGSKWVLAIILVLIAVAAIWYFRNKEQDKSDKTPMATDTPAVKTDTPAAAVGPESPFSVKLPDGTKLNVNKGGIEDQLVIFFNDPGSRPSRRFPFTFDQLEFNNGTAVISGESMVQIQNVATILKAYPKTRIKIGGFNEKGGDSILNKTISDNRASSVTAALKAAGANSNQFIGVEGFGSDFAKYPADAADSLKLKDRRISISIRAK